MKDECGVVGLFGCEDAANLAYLGLYSLQHRGEESAGIVSEERSAFYVVKDMGHVSDVFDQDKLHYLKGKNAIGHVRYSTTGSSNVNNIQPLYSQTARGKLALAHNGNLTNAYSLSQTLKKQGALFQSTVDTEIFLHLYSRSDAKTTMGAFQDVLSKVEGAYSLVCLGEDYIVGARDLQGFRPLVLGRLGSGYILASETCAFDLIGATYIRDIEPGEIVIISKSGIETAQIPGKVNVKQCIFEHVYFSRPDSVVFGENVHAVRREMGRQLAREHPVDADLVIAIPDSGNSAALGYAEESGIPFEVGMTRNHYVGRTFIQPQQKIRDFSVKIKLNPIRQVLEGRRVVVVDDSLVRGTTSRARVKAILDAGASEVHLRISSPPITDPCHFGIDTPKRSKLIAANKKTEEIRDYVCADSLGYLSLNGLLSSVTAHPGSSYCTGCFTGKYPIRVKNKGKYSFESRKIKLYAQKK